MVLGGLSADLPKLHLIAIKSSGYENLSGCAADDTLLLLAFDMKFDGLLILMCN